MESNETVAAEGRVSEVVQTSPSALAPLAHGLFRRLWIAQIISQIGGFMTEVALGWQMATLSGSPLMVSLLVTATSLPFFVLGLAAGALADIVDRRRLLLCAQLGLIAVSTTLAVVSAWGWASPGVLLGLAGALGTAAAFNGPAWSAIPAEVLPREHFDGGVTLNGVAMNIARVVGPTLGGVVVASFGAPVAFATDAATTCGVIAALLTWRRSPVASILPSERLVGAMKAGLRFARHSTALDVVLVRLAAYIVSGSVIMALLPVLARQLSGGATAYGWLLGSFGIGAVVAAAVLPRIRVRFSVDVQVLAGTFLFAAACFAIAFGRTVWVLCPLMFCAGMGWIFVLATLSVASQKVSPPWVRARAISVFLLILQGGLAMGSVIWGSVAERFGIDAAFLGAAGVLAVGALLTLGFRIAPHEGFDPSPTGHWPEPASPASFRLDSGPVLVEVEYRVAPDQTEAFLRALAPMERIRRRDGSLQWWVLQNTEDPICWLEVFSAETWAEHLRQHERASADYRAIEEAVRVFHLGPEPPRVRHFLASRRARTHAVIPRLDR